MHRTSFQDLRMQLLRDWKITNNRIFRIIVIVVLALMALVSLGAGAKNAVMFSQDFQWDAAKALCLKMDPYELSQNPDGVYENTSLSEFYRLFTDEGLKQKMEANQFPSLLLLLFPYTLFGPFTARILWLVSNVLFTVGIAFLLKKTLFKELSDFEYYVVILLMIAGTPFRNQLGVGQHTLFSFFFFMLALWLDKTEIKGQRTLISLSLAVCYFKYTLTAPLVLYFIYRKRYREVAASVITHVVLTVFSALWLKKSVLYMLTAPLKVAMNLSSEGGLDIGALTGGGTVSLVIGGMIGVFLVILSVRLPEGNDNLLLGVLILWSLIMTYHRTYDFFVLSVVVVIFIGMSEKVTTPTNFRIMFVWYIILLFAVYFGLRVFHENTMSRIGAGIIYYSFTTAVTVLSVKCCKKELSEG